MKILFNHSLKDETTFNCGGCAKWYVEVEDKVEFKNILKFHKGKYFILGGGSKTLCADNGYDGLVISTKKLNKIDIEDNLVACECGVKFDKLNKFCLENELSGLEWCSGIPASVGGAVVMNTGSFGHEFFEFVNKVIIIENNQFVEIKKDDINYSYRQSSLKGKNIYKIFLDNLIKEDKEIIFKKQNYYFNKKQLSQPLCEGSVGSIFKHKNGIIPSKIIDKLGLKGVRIGNAEVSKKHSGFIVNSGGATATDVIKLIELVKNRVYKEEKINLENEIIILE